jgi:hydrogenase maturation protease
MADTLLIAYGNPSRQDDGVALHLMLHLRAMLQLEPLPLLELSDGPLAPGLQVVYTQQLVPEMSEALAQVDKAVFIDAHVPGTDWLPIHWRPITPQHHVTMVSHHFTPETLLAWSYSLYGKAPQAFILSILGTNFDFGYELAPETERRALEAAGILYEKLGFTRN